MTRSFTLAPSPRLNARTRSADMTKAATLKGKGRIVEMEMWDKDFLDMMEPAYIACDGKAVGEFAFGCGIAERRPPVSSSPGKVTTK